MANLLLSLMLLLSLRDRQCEYRRRSDLAELGDQADFPGRSRSVLEDL